MPIFTLQPIVENAIKHGVSEMLGVGIIKISGEIKDNKLLLTVEGNTGLYKGNNHAA